MIMLTVYFFILIGTTTVLGGSICLKCDDVPLPNLCSEVIECGPHESCVVNQYVTSSGTLSYKLGCSDKLVCAAIGAKKRDSILTCTACCDGDLCNAEGCGQQGFSDKFGPLCYTCPLQLGHDTCNKISLCGKDQICGIRHLKITGAPENLFETKCYEANECNRDPAAFVSKSTECMACCNSTLCNKHDPRATCNGHTPTTTRKTTTSPPPPTTTSTTVTVTVKEPTNTAVCEDVPGHICQPVTCHTNTDYLKTNCKKTCGYCGQGNQATTLTTTMAPTTQITARPDAVFDIFCKDEYAGCEANFDICHTPDYAEWTRAGCEKTCGYCYSSVDPAPVG